MTLKEIEKYIIEKVNEGNYNNALNGLVIYVEKDPKAPQSIKLLNRAFGALFWLYVIKNEIFNRKKNEI
jgi:hypothetical protein